MKTIAVLMGLLMFVWLSGRALAHSELVAAEPAPGAQLAESPSEIRLTFSEPVAASSQIIVLSENFQQVEGLVPQFNPEQPQVVYTPLPPLEPGVYTVQWAAASADGHQISGSYSFSIGAAGTANPEVAAENPQTNTDDAPASRSVWWLAGIGLIAVGLPLALLGIRRAGSRNT